MQKRKQQFDEIGRTLESTSLLGQLCFMAYKKYMDIFEQEKDIISRRGRFLSDEDIKSLHFKGKISIDLKITEIQMVRIKQEYFEYLKKKMSVELRQPKLGFKSMIERIANNESKNKNMDERMKLAEE